MKMKYKILHLPTGTYIYQRIEHGAFYTEEELKIRGDVQQLGPRINYFSKHEYERLLRLLNSNPDYFGGFSISEHFECIEVNDAEI